jgi:hypothetical protein
MGAIEHLGNRLSLNDAIEKGSARAPSRNTSEACFRHLLW